MSLPPPTLHIAIIGAGPSGCYLAQSLTRTLPHSEITLFDQNVAPYGLIRSGVAADHQHTKNITRQFERVFQDERVRFAGNLRIGTHTTVAESHSTHDAAYDLTLHELHSHFDLVVHATGLYHDRTLDITGNQLPQVHGSGTLIRTLNSAPHAPETLPDLGPDVVIIGFGNVAIDLIRFFVKQHDDYLNSDISDTALNSYLAHPAQRITVLSRGPATQLKTDAAMLTELAALPRGRYRCPEKLPTETDQLERTQASRLAALSKLVDPHRDADTGPTVTLHFDTTPEHILGTTHVTEVTAHTPNGTLNIPATSVITAIGFTEEPSTALPTTSASYLTGWARRGPTGAIPENRACAKETADLILSDVAAGTITAHPDKRGFAGLQLPTQQKSVSFTEWQTLDAHELAHAKPQRIRHKLTDHGTMLRIATTPPTGATT